MRTTKVGAAIRARMTYSISSRLVIAPPVSIRNVFRRAVFWARHMSVSSSLAVCRRAVTNRQDRGMGEDDMRTGTSLLARHQRGKCMENRPQRISDETHGAAADACCYYRNDSSDWPEPPSRGTASFASQALVNLQTVTAAYMEDLTLRRLVALRPQYGSHEQHVSPPNVNNSVLVKPRGDSAI